ncbi:hypothetical protein BCV71DRAFT_171715 [Rhizopus microsporus]|uniref:Tetratricopeptide repeat protein 39C n=1 Tax=Rhizopus microsporus TaxID=58291 RepID=A0A1X0SDY8_RHIZD|nr:hypothetical protein BCV71DRAFT_171715 [Rhizopus microsporus]
MSYFAGYYNYLRNKEDASQTALSNRPSTEYPPNGVLRAHVIKAECSLQIAILNLLHESVLDYLKCVVYLKRAYNSYSYVWQEYQKMGADHSTFMDANTISCLQFGVGSVHLILSALPAKVLNAIYAFGWKPDKQLGFLLLNQCVESKGVRSSMATVMMLTYYSLAISSAPRILSDAYKKTAMKMLLDAQQHNTNSVLYLYFAGIMARFGSDLPLSTQSFLHTMELSRKEWAEVALSNACRLEIAINHMITGNWIHAASAFKYLFEQRYGSPAFYRYMQGACYEMIGERAQAIILFAEVPKLVVKKLGGRLSDIDAYVLRKVNMFQKSGFQNLDFFVPALEYMSIFNLLPYMTHELLEVSLERLNRGLAAIQKCEELEQEERMQEIATEKPLPDYFNELASLFVVKATVLNILGRPEETTLDLNWVIDHQDCILDDTWTVPFALWEAGISCWILDTKEKSQQVWKRAVDYSRFDFEHRLAIRLTLALTHIEGFTKEQN